MKKLVAVLVALTVAAITGVVVFGSRLDQCDPAFTVTGLSGPDLPAEPVRVSNSGALSARVATWNILYSNSTSRVSGGLRTIAQTADVIGVQELWAGKRGPTARAMRKIGWGVSDGNSAVRIFYDARKYRLLAEGNEKVLGVVRIEGGTAGHSIGPKSVQWVQLQDRVTGGVFFVVNHHVLPDIDRKGHPRKGAPRRLKVYRTQMAAMLSLVRKLRAIAPVAITGDHNVDARADQRVKSPTFPFAVMGKAGISSNWSVLGKPKAGTQTSGHRLIDYVWLTSNGRFRGQKILGNYGSDHHAVVVAIANGKTGSATTAQAASAAASQQQLPTTLKVPGWTLDSDQIKVAAKAIEVGKQLGIPERGWIVAVTAALTESGARNLDHGDRDSINPWQMRPSTGWGTKEQLMQLDLAARAFYGLSPHTNNPGLSDIKGWEQMTIGQAAQAVEVSAFPSSYAANEAAARAIVAKLGPLVTGDGASATAGDDGCSTDTSTAGGGDVGNCPATGLAVEQGLTPDALRVLRCVHQAFPQITSFGGVHPDPLPDHPSGRAVDFMIPDYQSESGRQLGWEIARWVKDHRVQLGTQYVIFDSHIWSVEHNDKGWRSYSPGYTSVINDSSTHRNHVHVTVYGHKAKPDGPGESIAAGPWQAPISSSFPPRCGFHGAGCNRPYSSHTGQDFPAPVGTPVYAVTSGKVIRSESILPGRRTCTRLPICGSQRTSYGNLIVIQTSEGNVTAWYAHLTERRVKVGETVRAGQAIGTVGWQGNVDPPGPAGAHLHFEIRRKGTPINPLTYLRNKGIHV